MHFGTFDEAEKSVAAINAELQLKAQFGELQFLARCNVRSSLRYGRHKHCLSLYLSTVACMVPTGCTVTYLCPTTQLGMDALAELKGTYPKLTVRKKEAEQVAQNLPSLREKLTATADNNKKKRKK